MSHEDTLARMEAWERYVAEREAERQRVQASRKA